MQSLPIGAAEAGAAAVIDIEHRDPAARPELGPEVERARGRGGRTAVAFDHQRRLFAGGADVIRIVRRIEQTECGVAARGREFHGLRRRQAIGNAQLRLVEKIGCCLQDAVGSRA